MAVRLFETCKPTEGQFVISLLQIIREAFNSAEWTVTLGRLDIILSREFIRYVCQVVKVYFLFKILWHVDPSLRKDRERNS